MRTHTGLFTINIIVKVQYMVCNDCFFLSPHKGKENNEKTSPSKPQKSTPAKKPMPKAHGTAMVRAIA